MSALVTAWNFDGKGGGSELNLGDLTKAPTGGLLWLHLDRTEADVLEIISRVLDLSDEVSDCLFTAFTRPRCEVFPDGYLINLRGVNLNPGNNPVDMIAARMWIGESVILSLRSMPMMAFNDLRRALASGKGPKDKGDFLVFVSDQLTDRLGLIIDKTDTAVSRFEETPHLDQPMENSITEEMQNLARLNRYVLPQQQALLKLSNLDVEWLNERQRRGLRQSLDSVTLYLEELNELKERTKILSDRLIKQSSNRIEHTMYMLSVIAGIFLPLGFLTGLLGINVGGMPGVEDKNAFWIVSLIIIVIGIAEFAYFKLRKWI